jgi:nucleotide-binding universal stress UspA family protein
MYKTLLVHLDDDKRCDERLELGCALARRFDAHLVGLYALGTARIPSYALAEAGPIVREIETRRRTEAAQAMEQRFRAAERRAGVQTEWRVSMDEALPALRLSARYADLLVVGQPERGDPARQALAGDVLLSAGRPVLFVPYAGRFADAGRRVLVAWNASREAARAVTDALPLLMRAEHVELVVFDGGGDHGERPGADVALYLARHGVKAALSRQQGTGIDIASQILSRAADESSDLVVMGGYGHSRLRELALGGATRGVLESMTVPVLMAH